MTQRDIEGMVTTKTAANGGQMRSVVDVVHERRYLLHEVVLVLHMTGNSPARRDGTVIPALAIDGIYTEELEVAVFDLILDGINHASVFELEESAAGCGEYDSGKTGVPAREHLHLTSQ